MTILSGRFVLCFPSVFEKTSFEGGTPQYSFRAMFRKDKYPTIESIPFWKNVRETYKEKFDSSKVTFNSLRNPIRDGDDYVSENGSEPFKNAWFCTFSSKKRRPLIINGKKREITDESEIYSGCECICDVIPYAYNKSGNKGIGLGFNVIQKVADGTPLGVNTDLIIDSMDEFDDIEDDEPPF